MIDQDIDIIGIEHQTQKAILFNCSGSKQFWCPKAMIVDLHEDYVTVYGNFRFNYIYKETDSDDMFDDISDDVIEEKPKKSIVKKVKDKIKKFKDSDLDWLMDPNWKPKKVFYNGVRVR